MPIQNRCKMSFGVLGLALWSSVAPAQEAKHDSAPPPPYANSAEAVSAQSSAAAELASETIIAKPETVTPDTKLKCAPIKGQPVADADCTISSLEKREDVKRLNRTLPEGGQPGEIEHPPEAAYYEYKAEREKLDTPLGYQNPHLIASVSPLLSLSRPLGSNIGPGQP